MPMLIREKKIKSSKLKDDEILKDWLDNNREELSEGVMKWLEDVYFEKSTFFNKLRSFCESSYLTVEDRNFLLEKLPIELRYKTYYQTLGPSRCKANGYRYNKTELDKEISVLTFNTQDIKRELDYVFKEGEVYLLSDIKDILKKIYETLGFRKTPKATDISEYYEIKEAKKRINGKQKEAFKIIKKL